MPVGKTERHERLTQGLVELRLQIDNQKQLITQSLECLGHAKASLAVTKIVKRVNDKSLTAEEKRLHDSLIIDAYNSNSQQMNVLAKMEVKMKEIEDEFLRNE